MKLLQVYLGIYAACARKALGAVGKNAWTLVLPVAAFVASSFAGALLAPLGIVGGLILSLVTIALYSSYLYFVSGLVSSAKVSFSEIRGSFGGLFWPVMGVAFVVWIGNLVVGLLTERLPEGGTVRLLFQLAVVLLVLVNPTPEVIYDRAGHSGLETLKRSFDFVQENWIEWYLPNLALGGLAYLGLIGAFTAGGVVAIAALMLLGAYFHLVMVFRGFLFKAFAGSSHRQRMFRARGVL